MARISQDAISVADYLKDKYFTADRDEFETLFSDDSSVEFILENDSQTFNGKSEILGFYDVLKEISIQIQGYNVQELPDSYGWFNVTLFGTAKFTDNIHGFISTIYVSSDLKTKIAAIQYQVLKFF